MTFKVAPGQQPRTFRLEGELDVAETEAFLEGVGDVSGSGDVVLELGDLAFIDSSGVRALLVLADRLRPDDVLVLRNAGPAVQRVFDLVALEATRPAIRIDKPTEDERRT
jgi:anti-anti-sigma factor